MNSTGVKSVRLAYLLWLAGIFGWLGLHRFYLGKHRTALLWICTFGVLGVGALTDAIALKWLVRRHNRISKLKELRRKLAYTKEQKQKAVEAGKFEEAAGLRDDEVRLLTNINKLKRLLENQ